MGKISDFSSSDSHSKTESESDESSNLDLDEEDIFKPPQSVFLGGMTKGTLGNDNAMSIHFDFLPFLLLINKYNHELEISRFLSQFHDFSKCNSRFRLLRGWQVC